MSFGNTAMLEVHKALLRQQLDSARRQTDSLFELMDPGAFYERPLAERHRIIFYLGHLDAFDWNMICGASFEMKPPEAELTRLFAFGIDPVDGDLPRDSRSDWPRAETVRRFNTEVRNGVDDCLEKADLSRSDHPYVENGLIFWTAIEHRLMHAETLSYLIHWLSYGLKHAVRPVLGDQRPAPQQRQILIPAGSVTLGLQREEQHFGWDNEFEAHSVHVPAFEIDAYKVTNGQYLEFVRAGCYQEQSLWTDAGWNWIEANDIQFPKFWIKRAGGWLYRGMFGEIPLPLSWPVYVSQAEASAYARWSGRSLPTEAEFHRAAFGGIASEKRSQQDDNTRTATRGNFGFQRWEPVPVDSQSKDATGFGMVEPVGNGWEWTRSLFAPFAGFKRFPFYPGYSADFFDQKHFVAKGASARTAARLTRRSFRNWFQPYYPHIYAGFRCVQH